MNFRREHSEVKGCYFQVCASQNEGLPSVYDRVQNLRPAMPPLLLLGQNDELNHSSVNGSASCTSEIAPSFWDAATHIDSYVWGTYTFMFLSGVDEPSCTHKPTRFDGHFPKFCQQSVSEHMMILHNPGYILPKSHRYSTYCHKYNKWT